VEARHAREDVDQNRPPVLHGLAPPPNCTLKGRFEAVKLVVKRAAVLLYNVIDAGLVGSTDGGRDATRAEDAQGTPAQSHISPSILVYEDKIGRKKCAAVLFYDAKGRARSDILRLDTLTKTWTRINPPIPIERLRATVLLLLH